MRILVQAIYLVLPLSGIVYGVAAHNSYGMGSACCGFIGGVLGLITATLLILVGAIILSAFCGHKRFQPRM